MERSVVHPSEVLNGDLSRTVAVENTKRQLHQLSAPLRQHSSDSDEEFIIGNLPAVVSVEVSEQVTRLLRGELQPALPQPFAELLQTQGARPVIVH